VVPLSKSGKTFLVSLVDVDIVVFGERVVEVEDVVDVDVEAVVEMIVVELTMFSDLADVLEGCITLGVGVSVIVIVVLCSVALDGFASEAGLVVVCLLDGVTVVVVVVVTGCVVEVEGDVVVTGAVVAAKVGDAVVINIVVVSVVVITGVVNALFDAAAVGVGVVKSSNASIFLRIFASCGGSGVADSVFSPSGFLRKHFSIFSWL